MGAEDTCSCSGEQYTAQARRGHNYIDWDRYQIDTFLVRFWGPEMRGIWSLFTFTSVFVPWLPAGCNAELGSRLL